MIFCVIVTPLYLSLFSVCLPESDWRAGETKQDQLLETLRRSKRVFAVLTETFIKDPWCLLQFRMAMAEKLESTSSRLIGKLL